MGNLFGSLISQFLVSDIKVYRSLSGHLGKQHSEDLRRCTAARRAPPSAMLRGNGFVVWGGISSAGFSDAFKVLCLTQGCRNEADMLRNVLDDAEPPSTKGYLPLETRVESV